MSPDSAAAGPPEEAQSDRHQHYRSPDQTAAKVRNRLSEPSSTAEQIRLKEVTVLIWRVYFCWRFNLTPISYFCIPRCKLKSSNNAQTWPTADSNEFPKKQQEQKTQRTNRKLSLNTYSFTTLHAECTYSVVKAFH